MIFIAGHLYYNGEFHPNSGIEISGHTINRIIQNPERIEEDWNYYPNCIMLPGFINAHAHLELTLLEGKIPEQLPFPQWVGELRKQQADWTSETFKASFEKGCLASLKSGTTTVMDVGNSESNLQLEDFTFPHPRLFTNYEVIGLDPEVVEARSAHTETLLNKTRDNEVVSHGVAAHAPFSCSIPLLNYSMMQKRQGFPKTIHVAESIDEQLLFTKNQGGFPEFLNFIYPKYDFGSGWFNSLDYLIHHNVIPKSTLIAHGNFIQKEQFEMMRDKKISICHCPQSRQFFNHKDFPFDIVRDKSVNICLGTDSLASSYSLDMRDEMNLLYSLHPEFTQEEIFNMTTIHGAKALNQETKIGTIEEGFLADFILLETQASNSDITRLWNQVFDTSNKIISTFVHGVEHKW